MKLPLWSYLPPNGPSPRASVTFPITPKCGGTFLPMQLAWTSSQKSAVHISSQLHDLWLHVGSFKLAMVGVFIPHHWKTQQIKVSLQKPIVKHLSAHYCLLSLPIPGYLLVSCRFLKSSITCVTSSLHQILSKSIHSAFTNKVLSLLTEEMHFFYLLLLEHCRSLII